MGIFRVTFGFAGANTGWTENHAFSSSGATLPAQVIGPAAAVATDRVQMLGWPFTINGIRVSTYSLNGTTRAPQAAQLYKCNLFNPAFNATSGTSLPAVVALQCSGYPSLNAPAGYASNENVTYLGAPPVQCLNFFGNPGGGAGYINPAALNLAGAFNAWKDDLLNVQNGSWGWLAVTPIANGVLPILDVAQNANGQAVFTVADGPPPIPGTVYSVRVSGINGGRSPLNGAWTAVATTATTLTTKEILAFNQAQVGGQIRLYNPVLTFVPYGNLVLQNQTIRHKRGKPFLSEPGRGRRRVRG